MISLSKVMNVEFRSFAVVCGFNGFSFAESKNSMNMQNAGSRRSETVEKLKFDRSRRGITD
jgi:hypothetical protein